jgi:alcohol dehydrogenase class IV
MQIGFDGAFPHRVIQGPETISRLGVLLSTHHLTHVGVLMDTGISESGIGAIVTASLEAEAIPYTVIDDLSREPTDVDVERVIARLADLDVDAIVAVGGGSVLDIGKVCACLTDDSISIVDLLEGGTLPPHTRFTTLIPTTSGTGAEATKNAIFAIPSRKTKFAVVHENLLPDLVILDPELTVTMPSAITATTGMDALCHAMECYLSQKANVMSDLYALEAIRLIARSLRSATFDPTNRQARSDLQIAAYWAGTCITLSGTNAVHALSYPLGTLYHIPHGHSNAILLPHVMEKNLPALPEKAASIARCFGYEERGSGQAVTGYIGGELHRLVEDLEINTSLSAFGVTEEAVAELVEIAYNNRRLMDNNPVDLSKDEIEEIYHRLLRNGE